MFFLARRLASVTCLMLALEVCLLAAQGTPPTLSAISPSSGPSSGGTTVTLTGTGFVAGATVRIGTALATSVTVVSPISITATTAAHAAGTVNVVVTIPGGMSVTLANAYTYTSPSNPTVSAISPNFGPYGGGTPVTITGTGFMPGATVRIGTALATSVTVVSSTSITATTAAHAAGTVNVVVTNPGSLIGTLTSGYTYVIEALCDTAFEDCKATLLWLINSETVGIDVGFWFMTDQTYATALINRHRAGVRIRVLVDPRANPIHQGNREVLDMLQAAGIPMRYKLDRVGGEERGILHLKMMQFAGLNALQFSAANYGPADFAPWVPYVDYVDEAIYFGNAPSIVNSFRTMFDNLWVDTVEYANYANIPGPLTRAYATSPIDPELNFPPVPGDWWSDFNARATHHYDQEQQKIDAIIFRITNQSHTDALIRAVGRGVPVRVITEPTEYRNPSRPWHSWNVDRLYMAGVQIKHRRHAGLNHQKSIILYSQRLAIFGSSNWTWPSGNYQQEHNYFTVKPLIYQWFVNQFERKWNSAAEFEPFVPLPPDAPTVLYPANGQAGVPRTITLQWEGGPWAHTYDLYGGTTPNPPLVVSNIETGGPVALQIETFAAPTLAPGTTYYWRIVGKTMAGLTRSSPVWSFTTSSTLTPSSEPPAAVTRPKSHKGEWVVSEEPFDEF